METFTDEEREFLLSIINEEEPGTNSLLPPPPSQPHPPSIQPPLFPPPPPSHPPPLPPFENYFLADHVDDYSLSYIVARGSEYCAKLKQQTAVDSPVNHVQRYVQSSHAEPVVLASLDKGKEVLLQDGDEVRPSWYSGNKRTFDGWEYTYLRPNPRSTRLKIDGGNWKTPDEFQGRPQ